MASLFIHGSLKMDKPSAGKTHLEGILYKISDPY